MVPGMLDHWLIRHHDAKYRPQRKNADSTAVLADERPRKSFFNRCKVTSSTA